MERTEFVEAIKKARSDNKERKFKQGFDLAVNFRNLDTKKPENKIKAEIILPKGLGKESTIGVFADSLVPQIKKLENVILIKKEDIEGLKADKKQAKLIASRCYTFLCEAPLMPLVAKYLGPVLAVRNKMPKPMPPTLPNVEPLIGKARNTVRIAVKDSPAAHCKIGHEGMTDEEVAENAFAVVKAIEGVLPKGLNQIRNAYIKLTMGKPVKIVIK